MGVSRRLFRMIIDGKRISNDILEDIKDGYLKMDNGGPCKLVVVTVGNDKASEVYVRNKKKACEDVGFEFEHKRFSENDSYETINEYMQEKEFRDENVYGIILQMPVVSNVLSKDDIGKLGMIAESLDVDGFTPYSDFIPCTPKGILKILESIPNFDYRGKTALVIGRSDIVGRPIAKLLLERDCTVIQAHSKTPKEKLLRMFSFSDIVISAVGKKDLITEEDSYQYFKDNRHDFYGDFKNKKDRIIVDVGINRDERGKLCGDLSEKFKELYSDYYTPVPGGVGPMTVAMLINNVWDSYCLHKGEIDD